MLDDTGKDRVRYRGSFQIGQNNALSLRRPLETVLGDKRLQFLGSTGAIWVGNGSWAGTIPSLNPVEDGREDLRAV